MRVDTEGNCSEYFYVIVRLFKLNLFFLLLYKLLFGLCMTFNLTYFILKVIWSLHIQSFCQGATTLQSRSTVINSEHYIYLSLIVFILSMIKVKVDILKDRISSDDLKAFDLQWVKNYVCLTEHKTIITILVISI